MPTQLHQVLAVESEKKKIATNITRETMKTFTDKQGHFDGILRNYTKIIEDTADFPPENKEVVSTVKAKLEYTNKIVSDAINVVLSKEETNASGKAIAELSVDGTKFGTFSATSLLHLEAQLTEIRKMYLSIPTLDPSKKWNDDKQTGLQTTPEEIKFRTQKFPQPITLAPATDKHPAQVQLEHVDKQVGKWTEIHTSGRISPLQKSKLLDKIDKFIFAVKDARSRANQVEVIQQNVGSKIFDFIHKDVL